MFVETSFLWRSFVFSIEGANFGNPNIELSVTVEKLVLIRVVRFRFSNAEIRCSMIGGRCSLLDARLSVFKLQASISRFEVRTSMFDAHVSSFAL